MRPGIGRSIPCRAAIECGVEGATIRHGFVYNLYLKNLGDSPDTWVLTQTNINGEADVAKAVLDLLDKRVTKVSFAIERTT